MLDVIHKWAFDLSDIGEFVKFHVPVGAVILKVDSQHEQLAFWFLKNDQPGIDEEKTFFVVGTGHFFKPESPLKFINTVQFRNGELVLHVFEVLKEDNDGI